MKDEKRVSQQDPDLSFLPSVRNEPPDGEETPSNRSSNEKSRSVVGEEHNDSKDEKLNEYQADDDDDDIKKVGGEAVIRNGNDVSRFIVDIRDDGDSALTFRSFFIGSCLTALASTITIIYTFKPVEVSVSTVFIVLLCYCFGLAWSYLPSPDLVKNKPVIGLLEKPMRFCSFGESFRIKEHVVASLIAASGSNGLAGVEAIAIERLFYNTNPGALTVVLAVFSISVIGFGLIGLMRSFVIYPSEMVYWGTLPVVSLFQNLHFQEGNSKKLKIFGYYFFGCAVWEIIASYMFPTLNGISIPCLAAINSSNSTRKLIKNIFGGASSNEGLGILNFTFDWQYIGSEYLSLPLKQQVPSWIGLFIAYIACIVIYYKNTWGAQDLPILSSSLFNQTGSKFDQNLIFPNGSLELNIEALQTTGLPRLTGTLVWSYAMFNAAVGALITHTIIFYRKDIWKAIQQARDGTQPDPHWKAMQKYEEVPHWWYGVLFLLAFLAGIIVCSKGQTTLPIWAYVVAVLVGCFFAPFSCTLYALMGNGIATNSISKMIGGALLPGKPIAVLYFASWSHQVTMLTIYFANWLKIGQYTKIPNRTLFSMQLYGTLLGVTLNYVIMVVITKNQKEILIDPIGNNVWSGAQLQSLNSSAITWSLAKYMYGLKGYWLVPFGLLIGAVLPVVQKIFIIATKGYLPGNKIARLNFPVLLMFSGWINYGNTSHITSRIAVGILSQVWLRRYHPRVFKEYNYLVGAALDGGAQVMIFILSFAVFGASGKERPFPTWAGNPTGNPDYCNVDL